MDREATIRRARRNPSATERLLWDRLRQRRLGSPDLVAGRILAALEELPPVPEL